MSLCRNPYCAVCRPRAKIYGFPLPPITGPKKPKGKGKKEKGS